MIRELTPDDAAAVYAQVDASRDYLANLTWAHSASLQSVTQFIQAAIASPSRKVYGIFEDGEFCGCIELRQFQDHCEIGYWLGYAFRGRHVLQGALGELKNQVSWEHMTAKVKHNNHRSYHILHSIFNMEEVRQDETWRYLQS